MLVFSYTFTWVVVTIDRTKLIENKLLSKQASAFNPLGANIFSQTYRLIEDTVNTVINNPVRKQTGYIKIIQTKQ